MGKLHSAMDKPDLSLRGWKATGPARITLLAGWMLNGEAVCGHEQATAIIRGTEVGELRLMVQRPRPAMMPPGLHG